MRLPLQHIATLLLTLTSIASTRAQTFVKVSSTADIREKVDYLLVCEDESLVYAGFNAEKKDLDVESVSITDGTITDTGLRHVRLEKTSNGWFLKDVTDRKYIGSVSNSTNLKYQSSTSSSTNSFTWLITTDKIVSYTRDRYLASNGSSSRKAFRAYIASEYAPVTLFYDAGQMAGIESPTQSANAPQEVYDLNGRKVGTSDQLPALPKGIYIIDKHKIVL